MNSLEASARRAELDWAMRNRAKLTPEQRAKYRQMWEEMNSSGPASSSTAEVSFGPEDLDPLEAAAAPIAPDGVAGPARKRSRADFAVDASTAGGLYSPSENVGSMDVEDVPSARDLGVSSNAPPRGYDEWVQGVAQADDGMTRAERRAKADARANSWDAKAAAYDRATGRGSTGPVESQGPYPGAGRPGYERTLTNDEVMASRSAQEASQSYQRVPKPRIPFGGPVPEPEVMTDPEQIEAYTTREWDGQRNAYKPSQKDRDMSARGLVPVLNEDGSVGYSVGYPNGSIAGDNANRFPGASGRSGERRDLKAKGWEEVTVDSPLGRQTVYRPGKTVQMRYDQQAENRARERIATRAGISGAEAAGLTMDQLRAKAQAARIDDANARREAWKAQTMLAGGQPTGGPRGTKAITNGLMMLPEDQRNSSLRYMLPGGQLAAAVDAQNMQNANDVIKRFMTSGAAAGMNNPLAAAQAQMAQQQADAAKPAQVRAQEHVAAGRLNHPDVFQHADDIVNTHYSSRPGMLGVSSRFTDNEVMLAAQRLADDTGMPIAEAEKIMRRIQADRNRNSVASSIVAGFYDQ